MDKPSLLSLRKEFINSFISPDSLPLAVRYRKVLEPHSSNDSSEPLTIPIWIDSNYVTSILEPCCVGPIPSRSSCLLVFLFVLNGGVVNALDILVAEIEFVVAHFFL